MPDADTIVPAAGPPHRCRGLPIPWARNVALANPGFPPLLDCPAIYRTLRLVHPSGGERGLKSDFLTCLNAARDGGLGVRGTRDFHFTGHKGFALPDVDDGDRKSTRLNSSHRCISHA